MENYMGDTRAALCVVGLGYIGLPTAVLFATHGLDVVGVDVNPDVVLAVNEGVAQTPEPDLATTLSGAVALGALRASTEVTAATNFIIAVPTPTDAGHTADLSHVRHAAEAVATVLAPGDLVVLESTSPPGTTSQLAGWIAAERPDLEVAGMGSHSEHVHVAYCPERVLPGRILLELVTNDRVIGGVEACCAQAACDLYRLACQAELHVTDALTAEVAKLAENAYRDVNIAFANELAGVCESIGVDVWELIALANRHPRVDILRPGPGVGGHCIAVDPWFLVSAAPDRTPLLSTARQVNDTRPLKVAEQVAVLAALDPRPIAALGLSYKANVDDLRESPAISVIEHLLALSEQEILAVEPHAERLPPALASTPRVRLTSLFEALAHSGVVVLLVDHASFVGLEPELLEGHPLIDSRGIWDKVPRASQSH